ncbi:HNH endonuclease [Priestia filamentosa]|uniref:HNH endonuclease n=1 Tax=Priestia filamentosa TaxID=1402861 RepID=UPI003F155C9D
MRKLEKPKDLPIEVFTSCISNYRDEDLKTRLQECRSEIERLSNQYEEMMKSNSIHTLPTHDTVLNIVSKDEMIDVYKNKLVKQGQPGRPFYDKWMAIPKFNKCPICTLRVVSTLDHYLPKTKFPGLSVTPSNLIPACSDCNKIKTSTVPRSAEEATLHPYFDDIDNELWLDARVLTGNPMGFEFFVSKPENWDDIKLRRVKHHFKVFKLAQLYSLYAAEELTMNQWALQNIYEKAGPIAVHNHLIDSMMSCQSIHLNSWKTAMYRALANSEWFCNEGLLANCV